MGALVVGAGAVGVPAADESVSGSNASPLVGEIFAGFGVWTHFAGSPARNALARTPPGVAGIPPLDDPEWITDQDDQGRPIFFLTPTGVVVDETSVYAIGTIAGTDHAIRLARQTGDVVWAAPVPDAAFDSWSTPALDRGNSALVVASDDTVTALRIGDGAVRWQTTLDSVVVNASPVVTTDLGPRDRCFVTDFPLGVGQPGQLYCINVDPFDPVENPHQPGDIVWKADLVGQSSGNSPAYAAGRVFVACPGPAFPVRGAVLAFDARHAGPGAPDPLWRFDNTAATGFFGGVCATGDAVYASSYAFSGDEFSANTVRLDADSGALAWSAPSNRTDTTPVVTRDAVFVSSGLPEASGFGSFPTVQAFDPGTGALLWDLVTDSWDDTNANGVRDPGEFVDAGGWTLQPLVATRLGAPRVVVGAMPSFDPLGLSPSDRLLVLDGAWDGVSGSPLIDEANGAGTTPAFADGWLFTVGPDGLYAYGPGGGTP
ncbi:MAG: PQQ-binding-like beta-propeller repeat protein [Phycisphaerales bacterium]